VSEALLLVSLLAAATARGATPLVLAALGGLFAERSGVVDIGLEGKMLASAFAAAATAAVTGSAWAGLAAAVAAAVAIGLVHGFACITHGGNQVVSGMALNITMSGLTAVLGFAWFHEGGQTPLLGAGARFGTITLPGTAVGPSIEADIGGSLIEFPLGPNPVLSWADCQVRVEKNQVKEYRCELKAGYEFR